MDIADLLDSDQRILAHSTRVQENGTTLLTFDWGDGSPPLKGVLPEKLDASILVEWCTAVRRAHNARENSKATKKDRPTADVLGTPVRADAPTEERGGGTLPVPKGDESPQEALAKWIESSLTDLGRQREVLGSSLAKLATERDALMKKLSALDDRVAYFLNLQETTKSA